MYETLLLANCFQGIEMSLIFSTDWTEPFLLLGEIVLEDWWKAAIVGRGSM